MKETMRETLRNHEKAAQRARDGSSPSSASSSRTAPRPINTTPPPAPAPSTSSSPNVRRKPIGTTATCTPSSRVPSPAPVTRKPVGRTSSPSSGTADYTHIRTVTPPAPFPKPSSASLASASLSSGEAKTGSGAADFPDRAAWAAAEAAYLRDYARRHSVARRRQRRPAAAVRRKGIVTMYWEAPAGDGEVLGALVREGWREWRGRRRRGEEVEAEEGRRRRYERRRDEGLVRWLEGRMEGGEAGRLGELAGLKGGEGRPSSEGTRHRRGQRARSGSRATPVGAGSSLHNYTKHTAYVHDGTTPDDLDILVSKVTDKFSLWGKEVSERAAEAKEWKREERQRKEREALKKTISAPRPVDDSDGAVGDAGWAKPSSGRLSVEPSARPSFGSERSGRPLLDASKTSGSMADRMAKRSNGFEIPFWPRDKKDKKTSAASSAQASPQQQKYTLPCDEEYNRRGTQIGQFMDPPTDLAAAPWNQHVNKANPFSPTSSSKASSDKDKSKHQQRSNSPNSFFSKFVPSPTSLFSSSSSSSRHHSPSPRQELQRRGSDESFFGCVGISVDDERAAQPVNHHAREDRQLKELDFRAPPTPPEGVRELFARKNPPKFGLFNQAAGGGGGGRTPFADSDDEDDAHRQPPARVSPPPPLLLNAQHCPSVSDPRVGRHSMAAELVPGSPRGDRRGGDDGRDARASSPVVDGNRVSWWDPPSPPPALSRGKGKGRAAGAGQEEVYTPPRQEWKKVGETGGEEEAARAQYWKDYRKKLRNTKFSRASGWDEGKPF